MKVLVVDDDEMTREAVKLQLENPSPEELRETVIPQVTLLSTFEEAQQALERDAFAVAFIDIRLGARRKGGIQLLRFARKEAPSTIVVMMTAVRDEETIEECLTAGAADYMFKPFEYRMIHDFLKRARCFHRHLRMNQALRAQAGKNAIAPVHLSSKSPKFQEVIERARRLKGKSLAIFIGGETGVGKDVMARYLWTLEEDDCRVFIPVHCGAIAPTLVESELFGYRKGAFTGANENKVGKFEAADGGDIFLDEVGTMPLDVQAKLLRVLQDKKVTPVGSTVPKQLSFRVISASNEDLGRLAQEGKFREDLMFRLKQVTLEIPPLRERMEDLDDLISTFLMAAHHWDKRLAADAWDLCRRYDWPGNVRELENAIIAAAELSDSKEITARDIIPQLQRASVSVPSTLAPAPRSVDADSFGLTADRVRGNFASLLLNFEQAMVRYALNVTHTAQEAAQFLGIARTTLNYKRKTWGWAELEE